MRRISSIVWLLGFLSPAFSVDAAQDAALTAVTYSSQSSDRVLFDLSASVHHRYFMLNNPNRLVIDLENTHLQQALLPPPSNHPLFVNLRSSARNQTDLRVVIELKNEAEVKAALNNKGSGAQLQIDLAPKDVAVAKATKSSNVSKDKVDTVATLEKVQPVKVSKARGRDIVVAIDAGHGGKDVGAQGANGTQEKDVVFAIAKRLEGYVNAQPGMKAVMIRNGDYFVKLHQRVNIARASKADLFVSIHADAFNDTSAHGASVYTLSKKGASSDSARWLADSENASDLLGGAGIDTKDDVLASVLMDLSQTAAKEASQNVGSKVLRNVKTVSHLHREAVQKAGFVVLKSPDIPSILVETAFISNPDEEQRLNTNAYQDKMASALFRGIVAHFKQYAPANTLMAQMSKSGKVQSLAKAEPIEEAVVESRVRVVRSDIDDGSVSTAASKSQHVINQGETLSGIAQQYGVSMRALRMANGMDDGNVRVGQVLQIPRNS